jgi:AraC family transcriptional regulator
MPANDLELRTLRPIRVAYMRRVGPYGSPEITAMWGRFHAWCEANGLMSPRRTMYGVAQDNPNITPPDRLRYDACVEIDDGFQRNGVVDVQTLPGGTFACTSFRGTAAEIPAAWVRFLGHTIPQSGYEPDLVPGIEIYGSDFAVDPKTGAFECVLCMPVRNA